MDEAVAVSNPVVEEAGIADAGAIAKNDAKSAGARYFIIFSCFLVLLSIVIDPIPPGRESTTEA
jgi:hypothetical protein